MVARREDLTEEQLALQRAYQRSWDVAQEFLADPENGTGSKRTSSG